MSLTKQQLSSKIIDALETIELCFVDHPHVNPVACYNYVRKLTKGKPLNSLGERDLRHLLNMFTCILAR